MIQLLNLREAFGPLDHSEAQFFVHNYRSTHQWQKQDDFHVIFINPDRAYSLDAAALESVLEYMRKYFTLGDGYRHLLVLQGSIRIKPKPEPEVVEAKPKAEPEPELEVSVPRWSARIRTKLHSGHTQEEIHGIDSMWELDAIVGRSPFYDEDIKNIKIKLEFQH